MGRQPAGAYASPSYSAYTVDAAQTLPVLGEDRGIEARFHELHVQEPAEEQIVVQFLAGGPLPAYRIQGDED